MNEELATVVQIKSRIIDLAIRFGPKLLTALLILIVGVLLSRALGRSLERGLARLEMEMPVRVLIGRVTHWPVCNPGATESGRRAFASHRRIGCCGRRRRAGNAGRAE